MVGNGNGVERHEREEQSPPPRPIENWRSVIGAVIAAIGATATIFFLTIDFFTAEETGYAGLMLLPPMLTFAFGCVLVVAGWLRERRRHRRGETSGFTGRWVFDPLQYVRHTGAIVLLIGISAATIALLAAGAGSVAVVEFSESNTFCSDVCHSVMAPEATAHATTAHSQIECVDCHVGAGANGFLEAKIGGLRQVWAIATGTVERPIPTPIHGGNINRDLCERCHAPDRNIGYKALTRSYFLNGLEDTAIELAMVAKVGGSSVGGDEFIAGGGIHYHMLVAKTVEFIARDPKRQDIAWIRVTNPDGSVHEYENQGAPLTEEEKAEMPIRRMECIDCHSRPAHAFKSPTDLVNEALRIELLPRDLFYVKEASVRALDGGYDTVEEAMDGIEATLQEYYENEDPDLLEDRADDFAHVAEVLRGIYRKSIFPEMKVDWTTHPNNIGHRDSLGCFRCHNEDMVDSQGEAIFSDCSRCHAILAQGDEAITNMAEFDSGMGFIHPQDGAKLEKFSFCSDCHTGGKRLYE